MFGLEYLLSFIKVLIVMGISIVWAIPVNFIWKRIGFIYFDFLPEVWLNIPYWHIVGLTILIHFIGKRIQSITPQFVKVENKNETDKKEQ
jgi:hypothetical protein